MQHILRRKSRGSPMRLGERYGEIENSVGKVKQRRRGWSGNIRLSHQLMSFLWYYAGQCLSFQEIWNRLLTECFAVCGLERESYNRTWSGQHIHNYLMTVLLAHRSTFPVYTVYTIFVARQHIDARYWYSKSVRPSVRYVPASDENGLTHRRTFSTLR